MSNKRKKQISLRHGCAKYGGMREVVRKVVREIQGGQSTPKQKWGKITWP